VILDLGPTLSMKYITETFYTLNPFSLLLSNEKDAFSRRNMYFSRILAWKQRENKEQTVKCYYSIQVEINYQIFKKYRNQVLNFSKI